MEKEYVCFNDIMIKIMAKKGIVVFLKASRKLFRMSSGFTIKCYKLSLGILHG
jgi:hypothetical protein